MSGRAISRVRGAPRIILQGIVELGGKTLEVRYSQWDTIQHWCLKLACAGYMLASEYEPADIEFEKLVGDAKADIYADNGTQRIWVECGRYDQEKLLKIRGAYDGKLILALQIDETFYPIESLPQFKRLAKSQRKKNGRINWRSIHKTIPINQGFWFVHAHTFPRIVYGIERNGEDEFVFISNWSIDDVLHPRKGDKIIHILPDGRVKGVD